MATTNIDFLHEIVNRPAYQQIVTDLIAVQSTFAGQPLAAQINALVQVMPMLKSQTVLPIAFDPPVAAEQPAPPPSDGPA